MLKLECCMITDIGNYRKNNEDNFYLNGSYKRSAEDDRYEKCDLVYKGGIFAVCDGMGGEDFGEKSALLVIETLKAYQGKDFNKCFDEYINQANLKICDFMKENNGTRSGSTLALVCVFNNSIVSYNIGDSRVYLFRHGKLSQLSEDHTRAAQMVKMGVLSQEQALTHRDRHILTQYLGIFPDEMIIQAHKSDEIEVFEGDIIVLCSDGLTDMLSDAEIGAVLKSEKKANEYARILKDMAIEKGGKDNITVGVMKLYGNKKNLWTRFKKK